MQELDLTGNEFTDDTFDMIGDALKATKSLTNLVLGSMQPLLTLWPSHNTKH